MSAGEQVAAREQEANEEPMAEDANGGGDGELEG
jgi:hypothetical protein